MPAIRPGVMVVVVLRLVVRACRPSRRRIVGDGDWRCETSDRETSDRRPRLVRLVQARLGATGESERVERLVDLGRERLPRRLRRDGLDACRLARLRVRVLKRERRRQGHLVTLSVGALGISALETAASATSVADVCGARRSAPCHIGRPSTRTVLSTGDSHGERTRGACMGGARSASAAAQKIALAYS